MPQLLRSQIRTQDGLTLAVYRWLPASQPIASLMLVHGLGEHAMRFNGVAETLTERGISLVGFDLRGHGQSDGTRGHAPSYSVLLDDLHRVFHSGSMSVTGPKFMYGHSMGGNLVLGYLAAHPKDDEIAGALITSPLILPGVPPPVWKRACGRAVNLLFPAMTFDNGVDATDLCDDLEVVQQYRDDPLVHSRISARLAVSVLDRGAALLSNPPPIVIPILLMHGSADVITSPDASENLARQLGSSCQFKKWKGLKHELHHEPKRDEVIEMMLDWIESRISQIDSGQNPAAN